MVKAGRERASCRQDCDDVTMAAHRAAQAPRRRPPDNSCIPSISSERGEQRAFAIPTHIVVAAIPAPTLSIAALEQWEKLRAQQTVGETEKCSMAERAVSPVRQEESITTREEMDFDDNDHEQETGRVSPLGHETLTQSKPSTPKKSVSFQDPEGEAPPTKPPRPLSPQQQAENTLIEAFPTIDTKVVKAVLMASGGKVEPAFNALLGMSDPSFQPEQNAAPPPPQPPRPINRAPQSQLEADEIYARQLAEQYNAAPRAQRYNQREPSRRGPNQQRPPYSDEEEPERNFFDDDLPEIGKNIQQGFLDTQKKVNGWISNLKKRIDGDDEDEDDLYSSSQAGSRQSTGTLQGRQNFGSSQSEQLYGIRKQAEARQQTRTRTSTEANRYDADPHELGDDEFERLELRDDEGPPPQPPRTSSRQKPNPDLFKAQPARPPQSGPVDEVDAADRRTSEGGKAKKWQPLTSVVPHTEEDNDPFSLGDDDDEKNEDLRKEDTQRLKDAARSSVSEGAGGEAGKALEESGRSGSLGTKNKEAEELLSGSKD